MSVPAYLTLAARYWKSAPSKRVQGTGLLVRRGSRAATVLHPLQLLVALVELVVAHGRRVELERVHRLDGRLVVEGGRQQRRGADEVTGGDGQGVRVALAGLREVGREVLDAPCPGRGQAVGGHVDCLAVGELVAGHEPAAGPTGRFEVAVEVVERQQLDLQRGSVGGGIGGPARGGDSGEGTGPDRHDADQASGVNERHGSPWLNYGCGRPADGLWHFPETVQANAKKG